MTYIIPTVVAQTKLVSNRMMLDRSKSCSQDPIAIAGKTYLQ